MNDEFFRGDAMIRQQSEPTYTLEEARKILRERECQEEGHVLEQDLIKADGVVVRINIYCSRCRVSFVPWRPVK